MTPHYARRRELFYQKLAHDLGPRTAAIVPGGREARRNGDNHHPFRQSSDLLYLTGFPEPEALAVFTPGKQARFTLLVNPRDARHELYHGPSAGIEGAVQRYGADQAFPIGEAPARLAELLDGCDAVLIYIGDEPELDALVSRTIAGLRRNERRGQRAPRRIVDLATTLHELRLIKDEAAVRCLRQAAAITTEGHLAAMRATRAGLREHEIAAVLEHAFRRNGGGPGYGTIVAAGVNATILHYPAGAAVLPAGALVLVDAGCEWEGYTADVTRTYPIPDPATGKAVFSPPQRQIYELVLRAQLAGIAQARPGQTLDGIHRRCIEVLTEGLVALGLLCGEVPALIEKGEQRRFDPHLTSHWLGMDVHDVGDYGPPDQPRVLEPGMVLTIEPGLYIGALAQVPPELTVDYRGLGVRIEDDVLITADGHEVLTAAIPKEPDELLALLGG